MTEPINDGGPAFPSQAFSQEAGATQPIDEGMSLRDWFAGQADIPWNAVMETLAGKGNTVPTVGEVVAMRAEIKYVEADAMLAEREKRKT